MPDMSKEVTAIGLGVWLIILPYLGVPAAWRMWLVVLTGVFLLLWGLYMRARGISRGVRREGHHTFVESNTAPVSDSHEHQGGISSFN